jgi:hypothetical protein
MFGEKDLIMRFSKSMPLIERLYWRWFGGPIITVKWPVGWVLLHENPDGSQVSTESADPNDHYRPQLEKMVGKQGRDWDWAIGSVLGNKLNIIFTKRKADWATYFVLKWS